MIRFENGRLLFLVLLGCAACGEIQATQDGGPPPPPTCAKADTAGIEVTEFDGYGEPPFSLGYPPYAIDGCRLLYVAAPAPGSEHGALRLRDLESGEETTLEAAAAKPRRPAARGGWMAWEATVDDVNVVNASDGKTNVSMKGSFVRAGEPRVTSDAVVFTGWLGPEDTADTDVFVFHAATGVIEVVGGGPGQQRFPDVSETHVAWSDFSEDPDGVFSNAKGDASDIVVMSRASASTLKRARLGKQAFPMLGAPGKLAYLDWNLVHPEPKFSEYELRLGDIEATADGDVVVDKIYSITPYVRPVTLGKWIEWVQWPAGGGALLMRRPVDLSAPAMSLEGPAGADLYTPTASDALTIVGAHVAGKPLTLATFARK